MKHAPTTHKQAGSQQSVGAPDLLFDTVNDFWNFKWDLAADKSNTKCLLLVDEQQDSLSLDWHKFLSYTEPGWCNHPYDNCKKWFEKSHDEAMLGSCQVLLSPCSLHRNYGKKFLIEGCGLALPLYPAVKFKGYDNASPVLHMLSIWHKAFLGREEVLWVNWKDPVQIRKVFEYAMELIVEEQ